MMRLTAARVALIFFFFATPVAAQSLFSTRGLGVPVAPVDARATALGGIGVGLIGFHTSITSPAEISGVSRRGVSAALQPVATSASLDDAEDNVSASRFPLMSIIYPVSRRIVTSIGYGAYLEQSWGVITESTQNVGDRNVNVIDVLRSRGGIAQARLNAAYELTPTLAVGAGIGLLTGSVDRTASRTFADTALVLQSFQEERRFTYLAPVAAVGARWDVAGRVRLGASAMFGGGLTAKTDDGETHREYGAPLEVAAGASSQLSSVLLASAGGVWSRMPEIADNADISSRTIMRVGGGVEYQGVRSSTRVYPVRLGGRWGQLPYYGTGEDPATEWSIGTGLGFRLGDPADPAAVADIAVERGGRSGLGGASFDSLEEKLWRFTFSLSLFAR